MPSVSRVLSGCQIFDSRTAPDGWACVPLGERIELAYGRGLREEDREPGDIDVYGSNGVVGSHTRALVSGPGILVGRKGTVGAIHYASDPFWPIDTVYYVAPRRGDNLRFLHHLLNYLPLKFMNAATGVPGLSRRDAYSLLGVFPRVEEQAAIARILDAVDTSLKRTREAVEQTQQLKKALLDQFLYEALGETMYADRPRRELPDRWTLVSTEHLLASDPKNGMSPPTSSRPPGVPTFSIGAIRHGRVNLNDKDHLKYAKLSDTDTSSRFRVRRGDILIVRGNANPDLVGRAGVINEFPRDCFYPDIAKRVTFGTNCSPRILPTFAVLVWNHSTVHNQVLRRAKTSNGTLKINNRDVKQIVLPVPPENDQVRIAAITVAIEEKCDALMVVNASLEQLKKSLMHDLFTGKVRVGDMTEALAP